ncbi:hypothetical protein EJB05_44047, partial [Eragrostis curvula]
MNYSVASTSTIGDVANLSSNCHCAGVSGGAGLRGTTGSDRASRLQHHTTCGNVSVPYPFGIQPGCYREGFNLTCDTSRGSPRLLLGDGSLRVTDIDPRYSTVRVLRDGSMINGADKITSDGLNLTFATIFAGGHYRMSYGDNELVLFGCDIVQATLVATKIWYANVSRPTFLSCVSFCTSDGKSIGGFDHYCSGEGCCQASFSGNDWFHMPTELHLRPLESRNSSSHVSVFLAEKGWLDKRDWQNKSGQQEYEPKDDIPLILRWDIMQGLPLPESDKNHDPYHKGCPRGVANICKSNKSQC